MYFDARARPTTTSETAIMSRRQPGTGELSDCANLRVIIWHSLKATDKFLNGLQSRFRRRRGNGVEATREERG